MRPFSSPWIQPLKSFFRRHFRPFVSPASTIIFLWSSVAWLSVKLYREGQVAQEPREIEVFIKEGMGKDGITALK